LALSASGRALVNSAARNVVRDGRLFGNDEFLWHLALSASGRALVSSAARNVVRDGRILSNDALVGHSVV